MCILCGEVCFPPPIQIEIKNASSSFFHKESLELLFWSHTYSIYHFQPIFPFDFIHNLSPCSFAALYSMQFNSIYHFYLISMWFDFNPFHFLHSSIGREREWERGKDIDKETDIIHFKWIPLVFDFQFELWIHCSYVNCYTVILIYCTHTQGASWILVELEYTLICRWSLAIILKSLEFKSVEQIQLNFQESNWKSS